MKHLILGAGNLGKDLEIELNKRGEKTILLSHSRGWGYRECGFDDFPEFDVCWNTIGGYSIEETNRDYLGAALNLLSLPTELMLKYPHKRHFMFSSNYAGLGDSLYGQLKLQMEQNFNYLGPVGACFRVANLYGNHKPLATLPGKIIKFRPKELPANKIMPTLTSWLADKLVNNYEVWNGVIECYPSGVTSTLAFAKMLTGDDIKEKEHNRPFFLNREKNLSNWQDLWTIKMGDFLESVYAADPFCAENVSHVQKRFGLQPLQGIGFSSPHHQPL